VTAVRVTGDHVLITVADRRTFRAGYTDAVLACPVSPDMSRGLVADLRWLE